MSENNSLITEPMKVIEARDSKHTGTIIFLHGSGDTGSGVRDWVTALHKFSFPHIRILFPTAPLRPYTPNGGMLSNVWFDRAKISPDAPEHMATVDATAKEIVNIVNQEISRGIPLNRIAIGGFSMGGGMAFHLGYRYLKGIAGVFALSSFIASSSIVYKVLKEKQTDKVPPLFMCHGTADDLILEKWAKETFTSLTACGVEGEYHTLPNVTHELDKKELHMLSSWITKLIPEENM